MTYRQLQLALKQLRMESKTAIKLNQKKSILQAEYARLTKPNKAESDLEAFFSNHVECELGGVKWVIPQHTILKNVIARAVQKYRSLVENRAIAGGTSFYINNVTYAIAA